MKSTSWYWVAACALTLVGCAATDQAQPPRSAPWGAQPQNYVPGEFIVAASPGVTARVVHDIYAGFGVKEVRDLGASTFLVRLSGNPELDAVIRAADQSGKIQSVQRNFVYRKQ